MSAGRRCGRAVAVPLLLVLLAGCVGLPRSGPVRQAEERSYAVAEGVVHRLAPPPRPGATPEEIVRGFLLASASWEDGHTVARRYLATNTAGRWRPEAGVVVLDDYTLQSSGASVRLTGRQVAGIDSMNSYREVRPPRPANAQFTLRREGNPAEWRIATLPDGLYLPRYEVGRVFRSINAYYLDRHSGRLLPDPVVLPSTGALPGDLVRRLLRGPSKGLAPAVRSGAAPGTTLTAVDVADGVAVVRLAGPAPADTEVLLAQLGWTLGQLGVTAVRVELNGTPLEVSGVANPIPVSNWARFDPAVLDATGTPPVYAVSGSRVGTLQDDRFVPLAGLAGSGRLDVGSAAVSPDGTSVATVSSDDTRLQAGRIGQTALPLVLRGRLLTDPSFDTTGTLWVLEAASTRAPAQPARLWSIAPGGEPVAVALPDLDGAFVREMRVSRDGSRIALIARRGDLDELHVAAIARAGRRVRVLPAQRVAPELALIRDVAWQDPQRLAVLAVEPGGQPQVSLVGLDGFTTETLSPVYRNPLSITAAPGAPLLVGTEGRRILQSSGRTWRERGRGSEPVYPG